MLFNIIKTTMAYLESMPKKDRKKIGQFLPVQTQLSIWLPCSKFLTRSTLPF